MDKFIQKIAKTAGAAVIKKFGKVGVHHMKSDHAWDCVTEADLLSDKIIVSAIRKKYPEHGIISEESGRVNDEAEYLWIIDPVDGTLNFVKEIPLFGVMIALVHNGEVILTVINLPATRELFFAKAGKGAFLNGKRIQCSQIRTLDNSFGTGSSNMGSRTAKFVRRIMDAGKVQRIQLGSFGSMAVNAAYVAAGRRDWMVPMMGQLHDFAPIALLLKEAGCKITDTKGNPWKFGQLEMVAANPVLHKQLLKLTKNV